jgi:hypothetical protein
MRDRSRGEERVRMGRRRGASEIAVYREDVVGVWQVWCDCVRFASEAPMATGAMDALRADATRIDDGWRIMGR